MLIERMRETIKKEGEMAGDKKKTRFHITELERTDEKRHYFMDFLTLYNLF
jgi:hypothetical protein